MPEIDSACVSYPIVRHSASAYSTTVICSVNEVVPHDKVISRAIEFAQKVTSLSPDSVKATKRAINEANLIGGVEDAWKSGVVSPESYAVFTGDNIAVSTL